MNYNFFTEIAQTLPDEMPPKVAHESMQQVEELKKENEKLMLQITTLEKALELVGRKLNESVYSQQKLIYWQD